MITCNPLGNSARKTFWSLAAPLEFGFGIGAGVCAFAPAQPKIEAAATIDASHFRRPLKFHIHPPTIIFIAKMYHSLAKRKDERTLPLTDAPADNWLVVSILATKVCALIAVCKHLPSQDLANAAIIKGRLSLVSSLGQQFRYAY